MPLQYEKDKLRGEKEALEKQNAWLDEELQAKAGELRELKSAQAAALAGLQSKLDDAAARAAAAEETVGRLRRQLEDKAAAAEAAATELRDERTHSASAAASFEGQVGAERKSALLSDELKQMAELALAEREKDLLALKGVMEEAEAKWADEREATARDVAAAKAESLASLEAKQAQVADSPLPMQREPYLPFFGCIINKTPLNHQSFNLRYEN